MGARSWKERLDELLDAAGDRLRELLDALQPEPEPVPVPVRPAERDPRRRRR